MSDKKNVQLEGSEAAIAKAKDLWARNSKIIIGVCAVVIVLGGGWLVYKNFFKAPKERKANEVMFRAEDYYRLDSINLALNGDGQYLGFIKIADKYSGTDAGNMANFYAGSCYIKLGENEKAVSYLKKFSTSAKQVQARAYKLLGDAYADLGKNSDALSNYKKAAHHFETDKIASADALFMAAYFADRVMKDTKEATALYKELKEKYPQTPQGIDADKFLAQLGVYNVN